MSRRGEESALLTLLFTDIVGSTRIAQEMGDRRWRELLRRHNQLVRRELGRFGGREVDTAGDGFFATFDRPAQGIRCAWAISDGVRRLGIEIRAGLHLGEAEVVGSSVRGVAVHVAARVMATAETGEVLVSDTLRAVVPGSGFVFEDRGVHQLKDVPEPQRLLSVAAVTGQERTPPLDDEEAAERRSAILARERGTPTRGRGVRVGLVALVATAAVGVALVLILRRDAEGPAGDEGVPQVTEGMVVRIDGESGRVVSRLGPLPSREGRFDQKPFSDVAAGHGSVWVENGLNGSITKIEVASGTLRTITDLGVFVSDLDVTEGVHGAVWAAVNSEGRPPLVRLSPATGQVVDETGIGAVRIGPLGFGAVSVASDGRDLWVMEPSRGRVVQIDPESGSVSAEIELPSAANDAFAVGSGGVWAAADFDNVVYHVDPGLDRIVAEIEVPGGVSQLAAGEGQVWGLNPLDGSLVQIDPNREEVTHIVPLGGAPSGLAVGAGSVWVSDGTRGVVNRVEPVSREVQVIEVGGVPEGIAIYRGDAWVVVRQS